jgi:hypothetical protein
MNRIALVVCLAVMASPPGASAADTGQMTLAKTEIKKWVDSDGKVHYGDVPPADADATSLHVRPNVIESDRPATPAGSLGTSGRTDAPMNSTPTDVPAARPDIDRYIAHCRDNRGVDCELEARQMIDGPAPVLFPGDPAVFPRPDLKPPPPGLRLKYSITP